MKIDTTRLLPPSCPVHPDRVTLCPAVRGITGKGKPMMQHHEGTSVASTAGRPLTTWKTLRGNTTANRLRTCATVSAGALFSQPELEILEKAVGDKAKNRPSKAVYHPGGCEGSSHTAVPVRGILTRPLPGPSPSSSGFLPWPPSAWKSVAGAGFSIEFNYITITTLHML